MKTVPVDGMVIREDTLLRDGVYVLPLGLRIEEDGVTLDGGGATLIGAGRQGRGISLEGRRGVTIRNVRLMDYYHGIHARSCDGLILRENRITSTAEIAPNTVFLDIWRGPEDPYGGAILLQECTQSTVEANDLQHQQNGL